VSSSAAIAALCGARAERHFAFPDGTVSMKWRERMRGDAQRREGTESMAAAGKLSVCVLHQCIHFCSISSLSLFICSSM
ncbi:unnamed protein product, partial [Pleuronectes platessa]